MQTCPKRERLACAAPPDTIQLAAATRSAHFYSRPEYRTIAKTPSAPLLA